jgi:uncharacterized protein
MNEMNHELINQTIDYVKETLNDDHTGHDWSHIERVYQMALAIAECEKGDLLIVSLAALLHDIKDHKFTGGDSSIGADLAYDFLMNLEVETDVANVVREIILNMSYKGGLNQDKVLSKEGQIVQDADRLDAIGAIGIARAFTYGGSKGRVMFDPNNQPQTFTDLETYLNNQSTTINHFYEKLLKLKDLMNTETAKQIAAKRHTFMESFLTQFYKEWESKDLL